MPYNVESAYAAQAALKKKSPAYMKSSGFKMKGSPMKQHPPTNIEGVELPTSETMSTSVAPVITPITGELVDPHHSLEGYGLKKTRRRTLKKRKTKNIGEGLRKKYGHGE
jgi:hypothetical protein|tara:strand:+ start:243 stop:572 length:330 start_codon:yes stop_codon:yes gene_type:complete